MTKAALNKAVEQRTRQRLAVRLRSPQAARKEAARRGAETRRSKGEGPLAGVAEKVARQGGKAALKKHEAELVAQTRKMLDAEAVAAANGQHAEVGKRQAKRPERATRRNAESSAAMVTVALRGEQAERFRALAQQEKLSLARLLVRMIEVFEASPK